MKPIEIITNAYEESRYHRQFHHTLFNIYFALYLALLAYQLTNRGEIKKIAANDWLMIPVALTLYAILPILLSVIFFRYHDTIARLNRLIAEVAGSAPTGVDKAIYDQLTFQKYREAFLAGKCTFTTGRGHWFFLLNLWFLTVLNLYVSVIISVQYWLY